MTKGQSILAPTEQHPNSCWRTPAWLVERIVKDVFHEPITLDPCTDQANPVGAKMFFAPPEDGILQPWVADTIYCNPPYGKTVAKWVEKCVQASYIARVVLLVPSRSDSAWFHSAWQHANARLLFRGRLYFTNGSRERERERAPFPSILFGFNVSLKPLEDLGIVI